MESIWCDFMKKNVSLSVAPIDGINGRVIKGGNLRVWIENNPPAIKKRDGYYIFMDLDKEDLILKIEGDIYEKKEIKIDREKLENYRKKIVRVRLAPNKNYVLPPNIIPIGEEKDGDRNLYTDSQIKKNPYRLIKPYESGEKEISFFAECEAFRLAPARFENLFSNFICSEDVNIEGNTLLIKNMESGEKEIFKAECVTEKDPWTYLLEKPLNGSYKRTETVIYPVFYINR